MPCKVERIKLYIHTNLQTHLLLSFHADALIESIQDQLERTHTLLYPENGLVTCVRILCSHQGRQYAIAKGERIGDLLSDKGSAVNLDAVLEEKVATNGLAVDDAEGENCRNQTPELAAHPSPASKKISPPSMQPSASPGDESNRLPQARKRRAESEPDERLPASAQAAQPSASIDTRTKRRKTLAAAAEARQPASTPPCPSSTPQQKKGLPARKGRVAASKTPARQPRQSTKPAEAQLEATEPVEPAPMEEFTGEQNCAQLAQVDSGGAQLQLLAQIQDKGEEAQPSSSPAEAPALNPAPAAAQSSEESRQALPAEATTPAEQIIPAGLGSSQTSRSQGSGGIILRRSTRLEGLKGGVRGILRSSGCPEAIVQPHRRVQELRQEVQPKGPARGSGDITYSSACRSTSQGLAPQTQPEGAHKSKQPETRPETCSQPSSTDEKLELEDPKADLPLGQGGGRSAYSTPSGCAQPTQQPAQPPDGAQKSTSAERRTETLAQPAEQQDKAQEVASMKPRSDAQVQPSSSSSKTGRGPRVQRLLGLSKTPSSSTRQPGAGSSSILPASSQHQEAISPATGNASVAAASPRDPRLALLTSIKQQQDSVQPATKKRPASQLQTNSPADPQLTADNNSILPGNADIFAKQAKRKSMHTDPGKGDHLGGTLDCDKQATQSPAQSSEKKLAQSSEKKLAQRSEKKGAQSSEKKRSKMSERKSAQSLEMELAQSSEQKRDQSLKKKEVLQPTQSGLESDRRGKAGKSARSQEQPAMQKEVAVSADHDNRKRSGARLAEPQPSSPPAGSVQQEQEDPSCSLDQDEREVEQRQRGMRKPEAAAVATAPNDLAAQASGTSSSESESSGEEESDHSVADELQSAVAKGRGDKSKDQRAVSKEQLPDEVHESVPDAIPSNQSPPSKVPKGKAPGDKVPDSKVPKGKAPGDKVPDSKGAESKAVKSKVAEKEIQKQQPAPSSSEDSESASEEPKADSEEFEHESVGKAAQRGDKQQEQPAAQPVKKSSATTAKGDPKANSSISSSSEESSSADESSEEDESDESESKGRTAAQVKTKQEKLSIEQHKAEIEGEATEESSSTSSSTSGSSEDATDSDDDDQDDSKTVGTGDGVREGTESDVPAQGDSKRAPLTKSAIKERAQKAPAVAVEEEDEMARQEREMREEKRKSILQSPNVLQLLLRHTAAKRDSALRGLSMLQRARERGIVLSQDPAEGGPNTPTPSDERTATAAAAMPQVTHANAGDAAGGKAPVQVPGKGKGADPKATGGGSVKAEPLPLSEDLAASGLSPKVLPILLKRPQEYRRDSSGLKEFVQTMKMAIREQRSAEGHPRNGPYQGDRPAWWPLPQFKRGVMSGWQRTEEVWTAMREYFGVK